MIWLLLAAALLVFTIGAVVIELEPFPSLSMDDELALFLLCWLLSAGFIGWALTIALNG